MRLGKRLIFAAIFALLAAFTLPVLADSYFLSGPKPEKKWMEYFYRANGSAPAPKPSTLLNNGTAVGFTFTTTPDVSGFQTKHPSFNQVLLGDLSGKTVSANVEVSASGPFTYYGEGTPANPCGTPASVRLYFETTNNDLGYSQYWWSNPGSALLASGSAVITASMNPAEWSDWDGHSGTYDADHTAAFAAAAADVQLIGLSFGGGCFFANGVGNPSGASFALTNFTVN